MSGSLAYLCILEGRYTEKGRANSFRLISFVKFSFAICLLQVHERVSAMVFSKNFYGIWQYFPQIRRKKLTCSGCMLVCDFAAPNGEPSPCTEMYGEGASKKSGSGRTVINFSNTGFIAGTRYLYCLRQLHCMQSTCMRLYVPIWIYVHVDLKKAFP